MSIFAALLTTCPSAPDFLEKIKGPSPYLEKDYERDVMTLSSAVLTLLGYFPGPWLANADNPDIYQKLRKECLIYRRAQDAIRRGKLYGAWESPNHYVNMQDLIKWAQIEKIELDSTVRTFIQKRAAPKKKGRKRIHHNIVEEIAEYYKHEKKYHITAKDLKTSDNLRIQTLLSDFIEVGDSKLERRIKTLATNVNTLNNHH